MALVFRLKKHGFAMDSRTWLALQAESPTALQATVTIARHYLFSHASPEAIIAIFFS